MTNDVELVPVIVAEDDQRSLAQYWFEIGFGACWAEAFVKKDGVAPFDLSDTEMDRAWAIAPECSGDPDEFNRRLEQANSSDRFARHRTRTASADSGELRGRPEFIIVQAPVSHSAIRPGCGSASFSNVDEHGRPYTPPPRAERIPTPQPSELREALEVASNARARYFHEAADAQDALTHLDNLLSDGINRASASPAGLRIQVLNEEVIAARRYIAKTLSTKAETAHQPPAACEDEQSSIIIGAKAVLSFLKGTGPLDGVEFGEKPDGERGNFWWRKHLSVIELALSSAPVAPVGEGLREALEGLEYASTGTLAALDAYNEKNGTFLCGPHVFKLGSAIAAARTALQNDRGEG